MSNSLTLEFEFRNERFKQAEVGLRKFSSRLEAGIDRVGPVLSRELRKYLDSVALALAKRHGNPWPSGTTSNTLSRRSGKMIESITNSVKVTGESLSNIEGRISVPFERRIHETGGIIRAKNAKYLTIPLPEALNPDGTPKKKSAREWDKTFIATSRNGNLLIFQRRGKDIVPLYVLKKEVKIPARLGMRTTLEAGLPHFVDTAFDAMLKEILK